MQGIALFFLVLVSDAPAHTPAQTVDALFATFNAHDVDALEALYAPDAALTSPDFCAPRSRDDIRRTYGGLFEAMPDIRDDVESVVIQGDRGAVHFRSRSEAAGLDLEIMTFFRFEDGLIVEDHTVFDAGGRPCEP